MWDWGEVRLDGIVVMRHQASLACKVRCKGYDADLAPSLARAQILFSFATLYENEM